MSESELYGVVPILVTPFDDQGAIDEKSLRRLVDFTIEAGVHGLGIALGSEVHKLTEAERDLVISTVIAQSRERAPVIVNTGAVATHLAVFYSQRAESLGASGVMCTPPGVGFPESEIIAYYQAISDAVRVPVIIQDTSATPVPAPLMRRVAEAAERVRYAKVESLPPTDQVLRAVTTAGERVKVFGGASGEYFPQELRRGAIGTMPWPSTPHAFVKVWDHWRAGQTTDALAVFDQAIAPLLRLGVRTLGGCQLVHKEVLRRQGVIATATVRPPLEPIDAVTWDELNDVCAQLGLERTRETHPG